MHQAQGANYVMLKHENKAPYEIFIKEGNIINDLIDQGMKEAKASGKDKKARGLCDNYYNIRTFGVVLSTTVIWAMRVQASFLRERVKVELKQGIALPRSFADYEVNIDTREPLPGGVTLHKML